MPINLDDVEKATLYQRAAIFVLIIAAGGLLVGCGLKAPRIGGGLADRCADIMQAAMPFAEIDIEKRASESNSISKVIARVEGTRTDLPEGSPPHDLAAECEFDNNILSAFRSTKGVRSDRRQHGFNAQGGRRHRFTQRDELGAVPASGSSGLLPLFAGTDLSCAPD
jgi:hypothetical protein